MWFVKQTDQVQVSADGFVAMVELIIHVYQAYLAIDLMFSLVLIRKFSDYAFWA
jgi:hypothetical protein